MIKIMTKVTGGRIEVDVPEDWPEGTEVEIHPRKLEFEQGTSPSVGTPPSPDEWRRHILETAGKWQGEFERPKGEIYEEREPLS